MYKIVFSALAIACFISVAKADLDSVCPSVRDIAGGEVYKSIASKHITDGRKNSTSFIVLRSTRAPSTSCLRVYDSDGNKVHSLGKYRVSGAAYSARFYGGFGCGNRLSASRVAQAAKSNTGKSTVYIQVSSSQCVKITDPTKCYNSIGC